MNIEGYDTCGTGDTLAYCTRGSLNRRLSRAAGPPTVLPTGLCLISHDLAYAPLPPSSQVSAQNVGSALSSFES